MNLLLDSAFKSTLIFLVAWAAARLLRRASADIRHSVWLAAILAATLLPAALSIPGSRVPLPAHLVIPAMSIVAAAPEIGSSKLPWTLLIWAAGASFVLGRLMLGFATAVRITRAARDQEGILYSDLASAPMTWGLFRPVIILPTYTLEWKDAERDLVIRHERAHIDRRDWLWQTIAGVMTAVFWFHPLIWVACVQLRREAEAAVDDQVLAEGAAASDYAARLLDVARRLHGMAAPSAAIAMVRRPELETRVRAILDASRRRAPAGIALRCGIVLMAAALLLPIGAIRNVHAQETVHKVGNGVSQPAVIYKTEPEYTLEAKDAKIEGTVKLAVEISPEGYAQNIHVVKSLDPGLDANAVDTVFNWRFKPGMKDGQPVTVAAMIEITFHLK